MSDLKVDYYELEDGARTAATLHKQFDDLSGRVGDHSDSWGDGGIKDAMHEFGTNWDYHREKLSEQIKEVGEKMESAIETFRKTEEDLAKSFDKERGGR